MNYIVIRQAFLTMVVFLVGSTLALAGNSDMKSGQETGSQIVPQKLERLEAKIKSLESRIANYLSESTHEVEEGNNANTPESAKKNVGWGSDVRLMEPNADHQKVQTLKQKIQNLTDRIDRFNKKPYLDTKGFKRARLKRIKDKLVQELDEAKTQTVWQRSQANNATSSESSPHTLQNGI